MEVIILHQSFNDGDAIGHDIQGMYNVLTNRDVFVTIYCDYNNTNSNYKVISLVELKEKIKKENNLLIYHHSIYWELGENILNESKCKILVRYHNITPPHFFEGYSESYMKTTLEGREQTKRFVKNTNYFWLSDSYYNNSEVLALNVDPNKTAVVAPFHKAEYLEQVEADYNLLDNLVHNTYKNVLFIGRVATNKGHKKICEVAKAYKELYGEKVIFWIVGGFDQEIYKYNEELSQYIKKWNLESMVIFTEKVPLSSLKSYILGSDVFLCLSEHEGFCVPLIEAQYHKLPVIACDSTAIKETLGNNQLVYSMFDADLIASAIQCVIESQDISSYLKRNGEQNYKNRFKSDIIECEFLKIIQPYIGGVRE